MKKAIFAVLPEKGHINPYIGPAQALVERGFEVSFVAPADISMQLKSSGLHFDFSLVESTESSLPMRGAALVDLTKDKMGMRNWITKLLLDIPDRKVNQIVDFLRDAKADVLVIDPLYYAAIIGAEMVGCPWVSMSNSLNPVLVDEVRSDLLETLDILSEERLKTFKHFGVEPRFRGCDVLSKHLNIAFTTEEFVGSTHSSEVALVGPAMPLSLRGDEVQSSIEEKVLPIVYASFGSQVYHWPHIFKNIIEACKDLKVRLILSVGDLYSEFDQSSEDVEYFSYAPQLEILKSAKVFITHGGANSVMEAIQSNTPLLISPICNDQFHQAYFVEKAKIGVVHDLQSASASDIRGLIEKLLSDQKIKAHMTRLSQSYQRDGSRESARLIENLIC